LQISAPGAGEDSSELWCGVDHDRENGATLLIHPIDFATQFDRKIRSRMWGREMLERSIFDPVALVSG
jgi:hypothetical protein